MNIATSCLKPLLAHFKQTHQSGDTDINISTHDHESSTHGYLATDIIPSESNPSFQLYVSDDIAKNAGGNESSIYSENTLRASLAKITKKRPNDIIHPIKNGTFLSFIRDFGTTNNSMVEDISKLIINNFSKNYTSK